MINIISSSRYKLNRPLIRQTVGSILNKHISLADKILNIVFIGKNKMKKIAKKYKGEDLALPVLSFSYLNEEHPPKEKLIGEIFICYPQAVLLAAQREKKVDQTINFLIEHGLKNILGRQNFV